MGWKKKLEVTNPQTIWQAQTNEFFVQQWMNDIYQRKIFFFRLNKKWFWNIFQIVWRRKGAKCQEYNDSKSFFRGWIIFWWTKVTFWPLEAKNIKRSELKPSCIHSVLRIPEDELRSIRAKVGRKKSWREVQIYSLLHVESNIIEVNTKQKKNFNGLGYKICPL